MEFRNAYRGTLSRAWVRLDFQAPDGTVLPLDLVVDTASDDGLVIRKSVLDQLSCGPATSYVSHWGFMHGAWLQLHMPAIGLVERVRAYGNDIIAAQLAAEDPDFVGLVGLPILKLGEYGGNADAFWFRYPPQPTSTP